MRNWCLQNSWVKCSQRGGVLANPLHPNINVLRNKWHVCACKENGHSNFPSLPYFPMPFRGHSRSEQNVLATFSTDTGRYVRLHKVCLSYNTDIALKPVALVQRQSQLQSRKELTALRMMPQGIACNGHTTILSMMLILITIISFTWIMPNNSHERCNSMVCSGYYILKLQRGQSFTTMIPSVNRLTSLPTPAKKKQKNSNLCGNAFSQTLITPFTTTFCIFNTTGGCMNQACRFRDRFSAALVSVLNLTSWSWSRCFKVGLETEHFLVFDALRSYCFCCVNKVHNCTLRF